MADVLIDIDEVAKLLGVSKSMLQSAKLLLTDFPEPVKRDAGRLMYSQSAMAAWKRGKNVKRVVNDAYILRKKQQEEAREERLSAFNKAATAFNSGAYMPRRQRQ